MRLLPALCAGAFCALSSCTYESRLESVREVPVKSTDSSAFETGLMRAQTTYIMYGAITAKERRNRLGQYYYVTWTDGQPELPARLVFEYQQGNTGSKVHKKIISFPKGRSGGEEKTCFTVIGDEYFTKGPVLTWKVTLLINDKEVSSQKSYLWRDDDTTSGKFSVPDSFGPITPFGKDPGKSSSTTGQPKQTAPSPTSGKDPDSIVDPLDMKDQRNDPTMRPGTMSGSTLFGNSL